MIHPLLLGSGQRLFGPADDQAALTLVECSTTSTGVILATYRANGDADQGSPRHAKLPRLDSNR